MGPYMQLFTTFTRSLPPKQIYNHTYSITTLGHHFTYIFTQQTFIRLHSPLNSASVYPSVLIIFTHHAFILLVFSKIQFIPILIHHLSSLLILPTHSFWYSSSTLPNTHPQFTLILYSPSIHPTILTTTHPNTHPPFTQRDSPPFHPMLIHPNTIFTV